MMIPNNFASVHALASLQTSQVGGPSPAQATFRSVMNQLQIKPLKLSKTQLHAQSGAQNGARSISQQVLQDTAGLALT